MYKIKIGILGYGKLGCHAEKAINDLPDAEVGAVFTRRPAQVRTVSRERVEPPEALLNYKGRIDVMLLCGGSARDLPHEMPLVAQHFCFADSYDNHKRIPEYFSLADGLLRESGNVGVISAGWDPGLLSIQRLIGNAVLQNASCYTFWGKGVSQGHTDAIRRIEGVKHCIQYTVPDEDAVASVRRGENPRLNPHEAHTRHAYIVPLENASTDAIRQAVIDTPDYFKGYKTFVYFISEEEFFKNHASMRHGGTVLCSGKGAGGANHTIEYTLRLESNPSFTASVLVACARAAFRLKREGVTGAKSVFDIPLSYLSPRPALELYKDFL